MNLCLLHEIWKFPRLQKFCYSDLQLLKGALGSFQILLKDADSNFGGKVSYQEQTLHVLKSVCLENKDFFSWNDSWKAKVRTTYSFLIFKYNSQIQHIFLKYQSKYKLRLLQLNFLQKLKECLNPFEKFNNYWNH